MSTEGLRNLIHQECQRFMDRRSQRRPCIVDGYNPQLHAVKVKLQPSDTLSGWIQIETDQVGLLVAPNVGDPGWLEPHDDDGRAWVFVGSNHNDNFPPPIEIAAGEWYYKNKSGSSLYFKSDGSLTATDKGGASIAFDGAGNIAMTGKAGQTIVLDASGNIILTPAGSGKVELGGTGGLKVARDTDLTTPGNLVHATSTKVTVV